MKIVGLTGGIGSGKSTVADFFSMLGISVYKADLAAKKLMTSNPNLILGIKKLLGEESYLNQELNKAYVSAKIFKDPSLLEKMNALVHPAVKADFWEWVQQQSGPYVIREAAILFESGTYSDCSFIITVTAPEEDRIKRVMKRDQIQEEDVRSRIANQWTDEQKIARSHAVINNSSSHLLIPQILRLDELLRK
ncbi:MAG: dephospho-CoA kinase [Bacteroidia bacterium]|nr:dephospho-CoA kinase [Bacteroidia bacterium]